MIKKYTCTTLTLALALLVATADVSALTLGRVRGAALLGQSLDVSVPVQSDSEDELSVTCFTADVFYGDVRIEPGLVTVATQPSSAGKMATVRVFSAAKVDEPVVTIYLKSVCVQKTSRRYVLLADIASDTQAIPVQAVPLIAQPVILAPRQPQLPPVPLAPSSGEGRTEVAGKRIASRSTKSTVTAKPAPQTVPRGASSQSANERKPRLKLAPLDMSVERDLILRSTSELVYTPTEDLQKRVEALAIWRALNASAQDILRDEAKMQALEGDFKRLSDVTAKNSQTLQEVTGRLEQSEAQRYANPLVYALAVALMACLTGIALLWQRLRKAGAGNAPWWGGDAGLSAQHFEAKEKLADVQGVAPPASTPPPIAAPWAEPPVTLQQPKIEAAPAAAPPLTDSVDIDLELGESVFSAIGKSVAPSVPIAAGNPTQPAQITAVLADFQPSTLSALRAINTKEMLDVRQQADFFMALGQYEEAIRLLVTSIQDSEGSNPLLYLDVLKIFYTLSRKAEFDAYRAEFNRQFTGIVPFYAEFNASGNALDAYPDVCKKISELWPTAEAIEFIEHRLVRTPQESPDHGLDLEAFRDLLLLHAIARRIDSVAVSGLAPFSAARTAPAALGLAAPSQPEAGVDLDLSTGAGNLIDFDVSAYGLGQKDAPETEPPTH